MVLHGQKKMRRLSNPIACWASKVLKETRSSHLAVSKGRVGPYRNKDEFSKCKNECFAETREEKFVGLLIRGTVVKVLLITSIQGLTVGSS